MTDPSDTDVDPEVDTDQDAGTDFGDDDGNRSEANADVESRSRTALDELVEDLRDRYDDFETVSEDWVQPTGGYESLVDRFETGHGGGAGAWVYDDAGRVLLVEVGDGHGWSDPGGQRRAGESFEACARRAVRESTGVEVRVDGVLELRTVEVRDGGDPDRPTLLEPIVVFTARPAGDAVPEAGSDVADARWFAEQPDTLRNRAVRERPIPFEGPDTL